MNDFLIFSTVDLLYFSTEPIHSNCFSLHLFYQLLKNDMRKSVCVTGIGLEATASKV